MPTTDEELAKEQDRVARLRDQVASARDKRVARERELANDVTMKQLAVEAANLEAELSTEREAAKVSHVKAASPLASLNEQVKVAEQAAAAVQNDKE